MVKMSLYTYRSLCFIKVQMSLLRPFSNLLFFADGFYFFSNNFVTIGIKRLEDVKFNVLLVQKQYNRHEHQ